MRYSFFTDKGTTAHALHSLMFTDSTVPWKSAGLLPEVCGRVHLVQPKHHVFMTKRKELRKRHIKNFRFSCFSRFHYGNCIDAVSSTSNSEVHIYLVPKMLRLNLATSLCYLNSSNQQQHMSQLKEIHDDKKDLDQNERKNRKWN